jgi:hypothetical protein
LLHHGWLRFGERQDVKQKKTEETKVGQRHHTDIPAANLSSAISAVRGRVGDGGLFARTYEIDQRKGA